MCVIRNNVIIISCQNVTTYVSMRYVPNWLMVSKQQSMGPYLIRILVFVTFERVAVNRPL